MGEKLVSITQRGSKGYAAVTRDYALFKTKGRSGSADQEIWGCRTFNRSGTKVRIKGRGRKGVQSKDGELSP